MRNSHQLYSRTSTSILLFDALRPACHLGGISIRSTTRLGDMRHAGRGTNPVSPSTHIVLLVGSWVTHWKHDWQPVVAKASPWTAPLWRCFSKRTDAPANIGVVFAVTFLCPLRGGGGFNKSRHRKLTSPVPFIPPKQLFCLVLVCLSGQWRMKKHLKTSRDRKGTSERTEAVSHQF